MSATLQAPTPFAAIYSDVAARAWQPGRVFLLRDASGAAVGKAHTSDALLSIDPATCSIDGVISTDDRSMDGDVLLTEGIDVGPYLKNPVVLFNHDPERPVGRAEQVRKEPERLCSRTFFAQSSPFAMQVFALYAERVLRGWSIRAMPDWEQAQIVPGAAGRMGGELPSYVFPVSRLIEYSCVTLPDNIKCVTRALHRKWDGRPLDRTIARALAPYAECRPPWVPSGFVSRVSTWKEEDHPRDDDGKFGGGGGGDGGGDGGGSSGSSAAGSPKGTSVSKVAEKMAGSPKAAYTALFSAYGRWDKSKGVDLDARVQALTAVEPAKLISAHGRLGKELDKAAEWLAYQQEAPPTASSFRADALAKAEREYEDTLARLEAVESALEQLGFSYDGDDWKADEAGPVNRASTWDESKHPRADDGKFGSGGGSDGGKAGDDSGKGDAGGSSPAAGPVETASVDYLAKTEHVFDALGGEDTDHEALLTQEAADAGDFERSMEVASDASMGAATDEARAEYGDAFVDSEATNYVFDDYETDRNYYVGKYKEALDEYRNAYTAVVEDDRELGYVEDEHIEAFDAARDALGPAQQEFQAGLDESASYFQRRLKELYDELESEADDAAVTAEDEDHMNELNDELAAAGNPFRLIYNAETGEFQTHIPAPEAK